MKRVVVAAILSLMTPVSFGAATAAAANPPSALLQLEREVALKMAHARDEGFTEPSKVKALSEAQATDLEAEKALQAGDYQNAESGFLKTKVLLHNLGI